MASGSIAAQLLAFCWVKCLPGPEKSVYSSRSQLGSFYHSNRTQVHKNFKGPLGKQQRRIYMAARWTWRLHNYCWVPYKVTLNTQTSYSPFHKNIYLSPKSKRTSFSADTDSPCFESEFRKTVLQKNKTTGQSCLSCWHNAGSVCKAKS